MTGKEVREVLLNNGIVLAELANTLGITAQTLNSRLNAKYFKDEYLKEMSEILNLEFGNKKTLDCNNLLLIIESQQHTIETLSRTIETLSKKINE